MKLYDYFRSSAAFRARIALNLKGLAPERAFIHLRKGEQRADPYRRVNPLGLVPTLVDGDVAVNQSLALIEYLEETHPAPPLLPRDPAGRARVRALAQAIACDIHPLNNLRVLVYLKQVLGLTDAQHDAWYRHWIAEGFGGIEALLDDPRSGRFCHGDAPTLADICLVPQVFNARRFGAEADLPRFPRLMRVFETCMTLPAFAAAQPMRQPDAEG
jgi:maleylacetoacetate isomerase